MRGSEGRPEGQSEQQEFPGDPPLPRADSASGPSQTPVPAGLESVAWSEDPPSKAWNQGLSQEFLGGRVLC